MGAVGFLSCYSLNIDQTRPKTCGVDTMVTPTAARMMQATRARMFRPSPAQLKGFVYRENRVPFYQRLFQSHDGKRQWWKVSFVFLEF